MLGTNCQINVAFEAWGAKIGGKGQFGRCHRTCTGGTPMEPHEDLVCFGCLLKS
jgi:hypothetical protein